MKPTLPKLHRTLPIPILMMLIMETPNPTTRFNHQSTVQPIKPLNFIIRGDLPISIIIAFI